MNRVSTTPKNVRQKWMFGVRVDGFDSAYFTKCDFPEFEFEESKFQPAGKPYDEKLPGRVSFTDVNMEMGEAQENPSFDMLNWAKKQVDFTTGIGRMMTEFLKDVDIVKYDVEGNEVAVFRLYGAWVKKGKFGSGEGGSSDPDFKTMTVAYQTFDRIK